jgi:1-acyl-sn-glycerol-3-phosphate acyltransferase
MKTAKRVLYLKRVQVEAIDSERLLKSPMLIIANHKSNCDSIAIFKILYTFRTTKCENFQFLFVAKQELTKRRLIYKVLNLADVVYIDRSNLRQQLNVYNHELKAVKEEKKSVLIFIEGTRVPGDAFGEFHTGVLRLAYDAMIPIVPAVIYGSSGLMDSNKTNINHDRKVIIKFLKPLNPYDFMHNHTE